MKATDGLTVRGRTLGQGLPAICLPVMGANASEVLHSLHAAQAAHPDVIEWRLDWLEETEDPLSLLTQLRTSLPDTPLLVTFRSTHDGGQRELSPQAYEALLRQVISSGCADLIDVELAFGEETVRRLIDCAHAAQVAVICSNHEFQLTPSREEMVSRLEQMAAWGCDIAKLAVMPQTPQDVLDLLQATQDVRTAHPGLPLITMSMGKLGMVSRLCGELVGSVLTFGCAEQASAPGQVEAGQLRRILELLHLDG